ncbi:MAG: alpha-L-fucosidase [Paraprevotella sp.]|nr:alpha-L-fucosidase [Paraprevotella sp.]
MFIHFNMPTFADEDWPDPDMPGQDFYPRKLDCNQWADAAVEAGMRFGCLTTKHHSGFCIWDTKTTDYNVMNSPLKRDIVKEYTDAFRKKGLDVMLYYSRLDTHHRLRPGLIQPSHIEMIKSQLRDLLTQYGPISALIIDGWDAPWSRISYEEVPFDDIYHFIKQLQPDCLVMDLNAAKYPQDALFYTDIKSFEQNAGQHISKDTNRLPALSCLPLSSSWFWKSDFPSTDVKSPEWIVDENLIPFNQAYCTFILNVSPNRDGLIDGNARQALKKIGQLWKGKEGSDMALGTYERPITAENIAKHRPAYSSWSNDGSIMAFGNDDNFGSAWQSNKRVKEPWFEVDLGRMRPFNMITLVDQNESFSSYRLFYQKDGAWTELSVQPQSGKVKVHRFDEVWGNRVKVVFTPSKESMSLHEIGIYDERQ